MIERLADNSLQHDLLAHLHRARTITDQLFGIIRSSALYERPIAERHRIVFYLGHLEAFDWNMICRTSCEMESLNPTFDRLFEFGIDPVDGSLPQDQPSDWPSIREIESYNRSVRAMVDRCLANASFDSHGPRFMENGGIAWCAIEHRLMHAETLAYMFHWLPPEQKLGRPDLVEMNQAPHSVREIEIPPGGATLGLAGRNGGFGWDNEYREHTVDVPAFAIDSGNVTNAQYLKFILSGGYSDRSLWSDDDWAWLIHSGTQHPRFWSKDGSRWWLRTMFAEIPLPAAWPVYVSHAEATAFARWSGKALPTEAQYHRAAFGTPEGGERSLPWGNAAPSPARGNFDFRRWDPEPVGAHPEGSSAFGVADLIGNGWEWTATPFEPFPGFKPFPFYPGYSANFFDGKHYVMKGASPRTAGIFLRRSFRNWFQSRYPNVYATFRCVKN